MLSVSPHRDGLARLGLLSVLARRLLLTSLLALTLLTGCVDRARQPPAPNAPQARLETIPEPATSAPVAIAPTIATARESRARDAAEELLARVVHTYATCESYADTGRVDIIALVSAAKEEHFVYWFRTAFRRPRNFRLEYGFERDDRKFTSGILWMDGDDVREWDQVLDERRLFFPGDLVGSLATWVGVTVGISGQIPPLLLGSEDHSFVHVLRNARLVGPEPVGAHPCLKVRADGPRRSLFTLWIDDRLFVIRQIQHEMQFDSFRSITTTTYEPDLDAELGSADLEFGEPLRADSPPE